MTWLGPAPAIAGSNVPAVLLVIPGPDQVPPPTLAVSVMAPPVEHAVAGAVMTGLTFGTTVTTDVSTLPQLPLIV